MRFCIPGFQTKSSKRRTVCDEFQNIISTTLIVFALISHNQFFRQSILPVCAQNETMHHTENLLTESGPSTSGHVEGSALSPFPL